MRRAATILTGLAVAGALLLGGYSAGWRDALGDCPHEDSCHADYADGRWRIVPGERPRTRPLLPATWGHYVGSNEEGGR